MGFVERSRALEPDRPAVWSIDRRRGVSAVLAERKNRRDLRLFCAVYHPRQQCVLAQYQRRCLDVGAGAESGAVRVGLLFLASPKGSAGLFPAGAGSGLPPIFGTAGGAFVPASALEGSYPKKYAHLAAVSVLPILVAAALGWYNWVRFSSPLEFGHNYLPEFMREENGQFSLAYLWPNLKNLLRPVLLTPTLDLKFPRFNGFLPFAANPLLLLWVWNVVKAVKNKTFDKSDAILLGAYFASVLFFCLHRTLGGWQFGARYLVDPFAFVLLFFAKRKYEAGGAARALLLAAVLFNFYGAVYMLTH